MMRQGELIPIEVKHTSEFLRSLKLLGKRYRSIRDDLNPLIEDLKQRAVPGDRIEGIRQRVYKVRLPNSDANRGKSGGYRVVYYVAAGTEVWLLAIYSKSDQPDIPNAELKAILKRLPVA